MRDPFPLGPSEFAGQRAPVGGPRVARLPWVLGAALLGAVLASVPVPVRGASVLSNGSVSPTSGTTATSFDFSVDYASSDPVQNAQAIWAEFGSTTITLSKVSGTAHDGTWQGSSTLPAGSHQVTFHATVPGATQPDPLVGPTVTVRQPPTPRPTPTPQPTPRPTPRPTTAPTPTPPIATPPAGATPPPAAPGPQSSQPPSGGDDPGSGPNPSSAASPMESVLAGTPGPKAAASSDGNEAPAESPDPSATDADASGPPRGSLLAPLLFVGGAMSVVGAAVLGRQWYVTRKA
jgi:hypothetical protein